MSDISIFEDEWRACLRAHYFHVIKERDVGNERSLITVLLQTGVSEDEIATWRAEALAELGWDAEPESASTIQPEAQAEAEIEAQTEVSPVMRVAPEASPAQPAAKEQPSVHEPKADSGKDEPDEPLVQLSLF